MGVRTTWGEIMRKLLTGAAFAAIMTLAGHASASPNLITNGDFSAGLTGWTETDSCCYYTDGSGFHEGAIGTNGMLSQTFADPAGEDLTLSFYYSGEDPATSYQYVTFDGVEVPGSYVGGATPLTFYSFNLGPGTGLDTLVFNGRNDPSYNTLDDVVVTASVPEASTWAMMLVGFAGLGFAGFRARRTAIAAL
jgi:PEP-CTERM motif